MIMTRVAHLIAAVVALGIAAGCGTTCLDRDPGESVLTSCVSRVELKQAATSFPRPPEGSKCSGERHYTIDLQAGTLAWSTCSDVMFAEPWTTQSGERTLTPGELGQLVAALSMLTMSGEDGSPCGVDKPSLTIQLFAEDAELTYHDSFYRCRKPAPHVDNIDHAFSEARRLAQME